MLFIIHGLKLNQTISHRRKSMQGTGDEVPREMSEPKRYELSGPWRT